MAANGDARAGGVPRPTNPMVTPLLTDLYQFTMAYAYWKAGKHLDRAVFDLYFRKNPFGGEFTIFGGLEECIRFIANFKFTEEEIKFLKSVMPTCEDGFFEYLSSIDCSDVEIYAIPEGYVVFPKVPLMRIEGPVAVIQLLETPFLSLVNYASLVTTNAARRRLIAGKSKNLLEFGLRRAQGPDGGISASRYSYMGGFDATSNVAAGRLFGIPIRGTHSHAFVSSFMGLDEITDKALTSSDGSSKCENFVSLVQKCLIKIQDSSSLRGTFGETSQSELAAFTSYALAFPSSFLALVDTYDINGRELHFSMVDGDFKKFEGKWSIRSGPRSSSAILLYEVNVIPRFNFPAIFLERIIRSDLPVNLRALACRAEKIYLENKKCGSRKFSAVGLKPSSTSSQLKFQSTIIKTTPNKFKEALPTSGVSSVLPSPSSELIGKWGVYGNTCRIDRPCVVDEIHLRRVDGLLEHEGAHWCVYASITVKAPVREVWNVLTAYENLPEFVPNLAISRIVLRDNNKVRIMQEGCKGLLYMVLHARVVMDLREKLEEEISFEQVEGDFYSFKGTWRFEQLGDQHTLLKYMVETKMHKDTFLSESILEEIIYEDLPSNLCAIRDYIEKAGAEGSNSTTHSIAPTHPDIDHAENSQSEKESASCSFSSTKQRPKVPGLQKDIEVLKSELENFIAKYGQDGFMPKRKHLRSLGSVDIEKAITRMGGFRKIASTMNLSLSYKNRKPRGYWDNLENLQEEMDPSYMPSRKSFERAGRYDIARALEKWGGLQEVSRLLSLELRRPRRQADSDERLSEAPTGSGMSKKQGMKPDKANMSPDAHKWLLKLKDLDVNWVEY